MNTKRLPVWLIASVFFASLAVGGQDDARMRRVAALELAELMAQNYVFPDIAYRYATHLRERSGAGAYDAEMSPAEFAALLQDDLRSVHQDAHLRITVSGGEERSGRQMRRQLGTPLQNATWIADDVAYLAVTGLPGDEQVQEDMAEFLDAYSGAKSLILDLRHCPGGTLEVMDVLFSRLYQEETHLVTMDMRTGANDELESGLFALPSLRPASAPEGVTRRDHIALPAADPSPWSETDVFVLTDRTASACEHMTLALQRTDRATIVGGTTRGAGHFGGIRRFGDGAFEVFLPVGRTYDPETNDDWEGDGIEPDVGVSPDKALAHVLTQLGLSPEDTRIPAPPRAPGVRQVDAGSSKQRFGIAIMPPRGTEPYVEILDVVADGIADKAGLRRGDRILNINGTPVANVAPGEFAGYMRGASLGLLVEREGESMQFELAKDPRQ